MSATREHRNAEKMEHAIAAVGASIKVLEDTYETLSFALPDEYPAMDELIVNLRTAHKKVEAADQNV